MPVWSAARSGRCPGSTPNSPLTLGDVTSSTTAWSARPFGVTISRSILSAMFCAMRGLGAQLARLLLGFLDVADHVKCLLREVVVLPGDDLVEAIDRLLEVDE